MGDSLGDRMKSYYEDRYRIMLTRRTPVILRIDGRAFHTYTKNFVRPFDGVLANAMQVAATATMASISGCIATYLQSDEASFLVVDYQHLTTDAWFNYNKSKIETVAASIFTAHFNAAIYSGPTVQRALAYFDARSFNLPKEEVANYFLWRAQDWERNSLSMFCQGFFSHRELEGKNSKQRHDMLHNIGQNWTSLDSKYKNGTWLLSGNDSRPYRVRTDIQPDYSIIDAVIKEVTPP